MVKGHDYYKYDENGHIEETHRALDDINLDIEQGQFIAVLGHNGSGKSTLAKHINALLYPTEGAMVVDGINTSTEEEIWKVCPNRANVLIEVPEMELLQILHVDYMCNECGNCRSFCQYAGAPYKDKFTLFATEEDMKDSTNNGFVYMCIPMQTDGTGRETCRLSFYQNPSELPCKLYAYFSYWEIFCTTDQRD